MIGEGVLHCKVSPGQFLPARREICKRLHYRVSYQPCPDWVPMMRESARDSARFG